MLIILSNKVSDCHVTWLRLVESCCGDVNVEHHFPLRRPDRLVEAEPDLATASQGVVVAVGGREETPADRSVGH
jgi:hypothetical protein